MKKIILRKIVLNDEYMKKYNLFCKIRYVYYDYQNKYVSSAGVPDGYTFEEFLKSNKHRFTKKKYPLF